MQKLHNEAMSTSVTIRNVPEAVRDELAVKAARRGQSLQSYLLSQLTELSSRPDKVELLERIRRDKELLGMSLSDAQIVEEIAADRK